MNITQIKNDINNLVGSTSATFPDASKMQSVNIKYQDVARLIWESAGGWQYDDSNMTTLPIAKATLVHNQQDYSLPSTAQRVERVELKDKGGLWSKLKPFDPADISIALPSFQSGNGLPLYYDLIGRSVMLYPAPSSAYCTLTSGLAVYVSRDVTEFAATATTATPGFATPFHRILSYAAAIDFTQDPNMRQFFTNQQLRLEQGLIRFYSKRDVELPSTIKPAAKRIWRQFI